MTKPKVSKKQQACVNRYIAKAYDRINLTVPKGEKEIFEAHAEKNNESLNAFIRRAVREAMQREQ